MSISLQNNTKNIKYKIGYNPWPEIVDTHPQMLQPTRPKNVSHKTLNYRDFVVSVNYSGWQNDLYSLNTHTKLEIVFTRAAPAFDNLSVSNVWVEILFWDICDLLDRVCRPRCWFVSDKPNLLLNSKKSLKCKILTLKFFSKMAKRELIDARPSNAQKCC